MRGRQRRLPHQYTAGWLTHLHIIIVVVVSISVGGRQRTYGGDRCWKRIQRTINARKSIDYNRTIGNIERRRRTCNHRQARPMSGGREPFLKQMERLEAADGWSACTFQ